MERKYTCKCACAFGDRMSLILTCVQAANDKNFDTGDKIGIAFSLDGGSPNDNKLVHSAELEKLNRSKHSLNRCLRLLAACRCQPPHNSESKFSLCSVDYKPRANA